MSPLSSVYKSRGLGGSLEQQWEYLFFRVSMAYRSISFKAGGHFPNPAGAVLQNFASLG